ncbi:ribonuclease H-like domain-containing protein [Tanacetum coccineum]
MSTQINANSAQSSPINTTTIIANSSPVSVHPMVTRAKADIVKPVDRLNLHSSTTSHIPWSYLYALRDPNWKQAMVDEYNALIANGTWVLVPCPYNVKIVRSTWLFKHKFNASGSLSCYKARLVANGRSQQQGIDCDETFSAVVKPTTIRTALSLVVCRKWHVHQLDVKNAFLHGHLTKTLYMHQPPEFVDSRYLNYVCHLQRSLYGLKQASRPSEFALKDLGALNYFLGIFAHQNLDAMHSFQSNLAGALQYITFTRPDLSYVVQQVCLYMHDPREPHVNALKHILSYVGGTIEYGLQFYVSSTTQLIAYTDADWAGCPTIRGSTSNYCVFLGDNLLSWSFERQVTLSHSSAEFEYRGVTNVVIETTWVRNLLRELHTSLSTTTLVYCDNVSVVYLSTNPIQHQCTKHIEIDIHFVWVYVASGQVRVLHVSSRFQYADIFINGLPTSLFLEFRTNLNVRMPSAQIVRMY